MKKILILVALIFMQLVSVSAPECSVGHDLTGKQTSFLLNQNDSSIESTKTEVLSTSTEKEKSQKTQADLCDDCLRCSHGSMNFSTFAFDFFNAVLSDNFVIATNFYIQPFLKISVPPPSFV